ncbi:hypothetical protein [Candidatus Tisiphia endosymbiont of Parasteatoda lunata]|uniref:hypothetical protein n=1 Tax=Candidatus Tisiphia endosymbiont of Parasteatoda lunata TaxID=3066275 RepID=UPI00313ADED6
MAAECSSLNLDDTRARILEITIANKKLRTQNKKGRSCYTTTICAKTANNEVIVLYFTGNRHGGENIGNVLKNRKNRTDSIQLMTDASNNNNPVLSEADQELLAIIGFCRIYKSYYIKIVKTKVLDIMMPLT